MEFPAKSASLLLSLCLIALPAASQQEERGEAADAKRPRDEMDVRLQSNRVRTLTRDEGLSIARVAMNSRQHVKSRYDCSHFVHGLYEKAGFPYPYASSSELSLIHI